jgi:hypothetical protein
VSGADIVAEIRAAYARFGIALEAPVTYGTYYRLRCSGCGAVLGNVGDRLLPGMAEALTDASFDLYAAGLLGCSCGHQAERARALDRRRADAARRRLA